MANLLVRIVAKNSPSLAEFKALIQDQWMPQARGFVDNLPSNQALRQAELIVRRANTYEQYRAIVESPRGASLPQHKRARMVDFMTQYERNAPTPAEISEATEQARYPEHFRWAKDVLDRISKQTDAQHMEFLARKDAMLRKRGDFVDCTESGVGRYPNELLPERILLDITDRTMEECLFLPKPWFGERPSPGEGRPVLAKNSHHLAYDELDAPLRASAESTGNLSMTWAEVAPYIVHKPTGARLG